MASLGELERLAKGFAEGRNELSARVRALEEEIHGVKKRHISGIKRIVALVMERQHALKAALEESRELFVKPKTKILHGIKIGFQKGKGKISWADDEQVVKLIKKYFPELEDILIKTVEKPVKDALQQLSAADLKRLGVTVEETGDQVFIKSTDSEVDKFVDTLLRDDEERLPREAA